MNSKGLKYLAAEIGQELKEKNAELESLVIDIPEDYHEAMLALIRKLDQEERRTKRKTARQHCLRTAAAFLVCFVVFNAAALGTSEAYREKVFSLFYDNEQGGVTLNFDTGHELVEEWEGYWYPSWLPEGYQLYAAERNDAMDCLLFMSEDMENVLRIVSYPPESTISFDTDTLKHEQMKINLYDGYYFYDEFSCYIVIGTDTNTVITEHEGAIDKEVMKKIAENLRKTE